MNETPVDTDESKIRPDYRLTAFWAGLFFAGMFGFPLVGGYLDWPQSVIFVGMVFSMFLLFPMIRAMTGANREAGISTPAMEAYNGRILFWSFAYVFLLFGAIWIYQQYKPDGLLSFVIALLPAIPIIWTITTIGRYIGEETDEYVRHRQIQAGIFATGTLLVIATIWGFLDLFGIVPGMGGYMAVPIWAIGLALGQLVNRIRGI